MALQSQLSAKQFTLGISLTPYNTTLCRPHRYDLHFIAEDVESQRTERLTQGRRAGKGKAVSCQRWPRAVCESPQP